MLCSSVILPGEEEPSPPCLSPTSFDVPCREAPCVPGSCTRCLLDVDSLRHAAPRGGPETRSPEQPALIPQHRPRSYLSRWAWQSRKAAFLHLLVWAKILSFWLLGYVRFLPTSSFILRLFPCRDGKRSRDKSCPLAIFQGTRDSNGGCWAAVRDRDHAAGCFLFAPSPLAAVTLIPWATGVTHCLGRSYCQVLGKAHRTSGLAYIGLGHPDPLTELHMNCHLICQSPYLLRGFDELS